LVTGVNPYLAFVFFGAAVIVALSLKMANVWQKFVILRMGSCRASREPDCLQSSHLDTVIAVIDGRIQTTRLTLNRPSPRTSRSTSMRSFSGMCSDAEKAALAITKLREAIDRVAQTSLREMIAFDVKRRCYPTVRG